MSVVPRATGSSIDVADALHRIAVLLEAGITPAAAWRHLARSGDASAQRVVAALDAGDTIDRALAGLGGRWSDAATAWRVATVLGAPLAVSLRSIAGSIQDTERTRDDIRAALAEPAATARLVSLLPLVGLVLTMLLGLDLLSALRDPVLIGAVATGGFLTLAAYVWTRRLVGSAQPGDDTPALHAELTAIALSAGVSIPRAFTVVADSGGGEPPAVTREVVDLSARAGAPAVELLRGAATFARHRARTEGRVRAGRLGARLLVPLGVCTLPAFLLMGVVPLLISVLRPATTLLSPDG